MPEDTEGDRDTEGYRKKQRYCWIQKEIKILEDTEGNRDAGEQRETQKYWIETKIEKPRSKREKRDEKFCKIEYCKCAKLCEKVHTHQLQVTLKISC